MKQLAIEREAVPALVLVPPWCPIEPIELLQPSWSGKIALCSNYQPSVKRRPEGWVFQVGIYAREGQ